MDLNKVMIIGRMTRDPETRTTPQGTNVTTFSLATNFVWVDASGEKKEKVEFHNIVAWRKLGEICSQYLKKGRRVYIEGRLQTRSWDDQAGVKKYKTEIVADNMIMLDRREGEAPSQTQESVPVPPTEENTSAEEVSVEEIPF